MMKKKGILSVVALLALALSVSAKAQVGVTKDNLDQNADQSQGNYAATNLNYLGGVGSLGMMQSAWKDPLQHMGEGQSRPGYTKYYWTPELVLPVRVREGMYTLINFPSWEIIENVYIGDGQSFNAEIQGPTSLMVYPDSSQFVGVDTNMIVFGRSGNKYVFYVQSETVNTERITNAIIDIEVVKNNKNANGSAVIGGGGHLNANSYSQDGTSVDGTFTRNLQKEDWIEKIPVDPTKFRFDIEVYVPNPDDIIIAPERVWRDNIFTYIDMGEKSLTSLQRPIVTLIVERSETPVGFRAAGPNNRLIVVEGMGDMVLRSGKRIVCLKLRRSDADGLENAIYAKTNDWDLQTAYASKPEEKDAAPTSFDDVYGAPQKDTNTSNTNNYSQGFWGNNSFFGSSNNNGTSVQNKRNENNVSYENMISDASGRENSTQNKGGSNQINLDNIDTLNSIPKVSPKVTSTPQVDKGVIPQVTTPNDGSTQLVGQYDIRANGAELVSPDYNNSTSASISFQQDNIAKNNPLVGNSDNNSSPVLITPKDTDNFKNSAVSAETEALLKEFRSGFAFNNTDDSNISIELGTDEDVNNLEKLWNDISKRYSATIGQYQPFYSVDTAADGQGKEVFHLRVGPIKSLEIGDNICSQLGRNGIFCSVVRVQ